MKSSNKLIDANQFSEQIDGSFHQTTTAEVRSSGAGTATNGHSAEIHLNSIFLLATLDIKQSTVLE
jgi:hypothetical protein